MGAPGHAEASTHPVERRARLVGDCQRALTVLTALRHRRLEVAITIVRNW
jgi:hypothetical protein